MTKLNPQMITLAREARALTMEQLATAIGVSRSKIHKYEAGHLTVTEEDASAIVRELDYPIAFFADEFQRAADTSHIFHHRKKASLTITKTREIHAQADAVRFHLARLLADVPVETPGFASMDIDAFDGDVEQIATLVRASWRLPGGPVPNLVEATERAGAIVLQRSFGTRDMDALSQHSPCMPPVILLNRDAPGDRQRWTLAHEIGHMIMHRVPVSEDPESEANAFASALLMPALDFRAEVGNDVTLNRLLALKPRWKVSVQAMVVRCHQLGMLTKAQYVNLYKRMSAMGWRRAEPIPLPPERPRFVRAVVEEFVKSRGLSVAEIASMVRISEAELRSALLGETGQVRALRALPAVTEPPSPPVARTDPAS